MKKAMIFALLLCMILLLPACAAKSAAPTPTPAPAPTETPAPSPSPDPSPTPTPLPLAPELPEVHDKALEEMHKLLVQKRDVATASYYLEHFKLDDAYNDIFNLSFQSE